VRCTSGGKVLGLIIIWYLLRYLELRLPELPPLLLPVLPSKVAESGGGRGSRGGRSGSYGTLGILAGLGGDGDQVLFQTLATFIPGPTSFHDCH
jgi:hypothetical protein